MKKSLIISRGKTKRKLGDSENPTVKKKKLEKAIR
jgi:hypothetical protein